MGRRGGEGAYVDPSGGESCGSVSDLLLRGVPVLAVPVADTYIYTSIRVHARIWHVNTRLD